jgi:outer membrane lipoprotein-sorting protein
MTSTMRTCILLTVVVTLASFVFGATAGASGLPTSGQFDQVNSITVARMSVRTVQSISFKGNYIRVDADDPNEYFPTTQIETPDMVYVYSPLGTAGQKIPIKEKQLPLLERMALDTKTKLAGATKSGTETVDGYACDVYKASAENNQLTLQFWVSTDPSFPFLIKTVENDSMLQKTTTVELQNIVLNNQIDDSLFDIPTNIKFTVPTPPTAPAPTSAVPAGSKSTTATQTGGKTSK